MPKMFLTEDEAYPVYREVSRKDGRYDFAITVTETERDFIRKAHKLNQQAHSLICDKLEEMENKYVG